MATREVEYVAFYKIRPMQERMDNHNLDDGIGDFKGVFVPELLLLARFKDKIIKKLRENPKEEIEGLVECIQNLPKDGFIHATAEETCPEDILVKLSSTIRHIGLYQRLSMMGIPLPGAVQASEVADYFKWNRINIDYTSERRHYQVQYSYLPQTTVEKWLPKLAKVIGVVIAIGLAVLTAEAVAAAGLAAAIMYSIGLGTLLSRYTHVVKTLESKLERLGRAYTRWKSGIYAELSWGSRAKLFMTTLTAGSFMAGLYWLFTKTLEGALKKFSYHASVAYALFTVVFQAFGVLDPVMAESGINKTRPESKVDLTDSLQKEPRARQRRGRQRPALEQEALQQPDDIGRIELDVKRFHRINKP